MKLSMILAAALLVGCDYIPSTNFEIETTSGEVITLRCPTLDPQRSIFTYRYENDCQVVKQ